MIINHRPTIYFNTPTFKFVELIILINKALNLKFIIKSNTKIYYIILFHDLIFNNINLISERTNSKPMLIGFFDYILIYFLII